MKMNFQEVLLSYTLADSNGISREEKTRISLLLEDFKKRSIERQSAHLIYDLVDGNEIIALLKNGKAHAIDFVSWNELLGCQVDVAYLEKQTNLNYFVTLALQHMTYEGLDEQKRKKRIQELQYLYPSADADDHSWYKMTQTIRGKTGLLVAGELYHRDAFLNEGVRAFQLVEEGKATLW